MQCAIYKQWNKPQTFRTSKRIQSKVFPEVSAMLEKQDYSNMRI